jgi:hypothetical protein
MIARNLVAALALAASVTLPGPLFAAASDYTFELVKTDLPQGDPVPVAVRLMNRKTGKPVEGAVIIRTRLDMAPEGMAEHATSIKADGSSEPGVYVFKADLSMSGRWQLSLAAKVQGEPETVVGKLIVKVGK